MPTLPHAKTLSVDTRYLHVELVDGRMISTPLAWYPELLNATLAQINDYTLICDATGIEWAQLDYHLSVEGMLSAVPERMAA
ncbi:DUF2442 domain-containing protein [Chitinibacter sp. S2-10]|uniref:DUF2442 domain-containing protein n=1 Tax=Chitinibacter sp. S2-10 TaxID=3373597 RepID=UPI0039774988